MTYFRLASSSALATVFAAAPALADLSADDVWSDWQSYMLTYGYNVTGAETRSGDTLTVSDVAMSFDMSSEDAPVGDLQVQIPQLTFTEQSDGSVRVGMSERLNMIFDADEDAPEPFQVVMHYDQVNFDMVASGDPEAFQYVYSADSAALTLAEISSEGVTLPADFARAAMTVQALEGQTDVRIGALRDYDQTFSTGAVDFDFAFSDPDTADSAEVTYTASSLAFAGTSRIPAEADMMDEVIAALKSGFAFDGGYAATDAATTIAFDGVDGPGRIAMSSAENALGVAMSAEGGLSYDISNTALSVDMMLPDVPVPIQGTLGGTRFELGLPVVQSDDPQSYNLNLELNDLVVSDMIWGMLDPGGQLPRDPATLQIALSGLAKVLIEYMDPAQQGAMMAGGLPAELQSAELTNLVLRVAGAALTGTGAFTFDASQPGLAGPLGTPEGQIDLRLEGGSTLMQTLVQMGLLPQEQAMGAQMMMGLF
ncbi:MAG: hypothetical protein AAF218_11005, partial [Pseudomonadota bacterium]